MDLLYDSDSDTDTPEMPVIEKTVNLNEARESVRDLLFNSDSDSPEFPESLFSIDEIVAEEVVDIKKRDLTEAEKKITEKRKAKLIEYIFFVAFFLGLMVNVVFFPAAGSRV
jgi:hypothetical protein